MTRLYFTKSFRLVNTIVFVIVACLFCMSSLLTVPVQAAPKGNNGKKVKPAKEAPAEDDGGFYGIMPSGNRIVFIVDNSNSMFQRHRFDAAAAELIKAITYIPYDKHFYVLLFSDTAYPVFHPKGTREWLQATDKNKKAVAEWLDYVELCLRTDAERSLEAAFAMKADEIFILTDGAFTDDTTKRLLNANVRDVKIHTIGLEVSQSTKRGKHPEKDLQAIAKRFGGEYRAVELDQKTIAQFGGNLRKKHNTRGLVWGLNLGKQKKKKKK